MSERVKLFSVWYRSLKDGKLWCESSDPDEVIASGGDELQKFVTYTVSDGWVQWEPSPQGYRH